MLVPLVSKKLKTSSAKHDIRMTKSGLLIKNSSKILVAICNLVNWITMS